MLYTVCAIMSGFFANQVTYAKIYIHHYTTTKHSNKQQTCSKICSFKVAQNYLCMASS